MTQRPDIFWGVITSMYVGNIMLLILNLPLIGMWVQLLRLPYNILFPMILLFTVIGVFASSNNIFDLYVMLAFGLIGYLARKLNYEAAPLILAFVLGAIMENKLRTALIISGGDLTTFLTKPISAVCLAVAAILLLLPLFPALRKTREAVALEDANN